MWSTGANPSTPWISIVGRTDALDPRAHPAQEVREVDELGLARGVLDHGGPPRRDGGHQDVLGGADAREVEVDHGAAEAGRLADEEPVLGREPGAHLLEPADVEVDRARPDVAPAGHRDPRVPEPRQQRPEHQDRGPHPADELVRRLDRAHVPRVQDQRVALPGAADAEVLEHLDHREAVLDPGDVPHGGAAVGQHDRGHQLERGVLRAGDLDGPVERRPSGDEQAIHHA